MSEQSPYLTVDEYAALVRARPNTIRRLIRRGELEALKIGGQYRLLRPAPPSFQHRASA